PVCRTVVPTSLCYAVRPHPPSFLHDALPILQTHQVHDVDHPHLEPGHLLPQDLRGGQRLDGGDVPGAGQHHVRVLPGLLGAGPFPDSDRKSTRLNSSHVSISYAVFCLKKKTVTTFVPTLYYPLTNCL